MAPRLSALCLLLVTACWSPTGEPDCLRDKTCECKTKAHCAEGADCIDGFCKKPPDLRPGEVGWPCSADTECNSKICLPKGPGNGRVCSVYCTTPDAGTRCPRGYDCRQALDREGFVCTPPLRSLCLTCDNDFDCNAAGDRCMELSNGKHCLQDCAIDGCPDGYECRALKTDAGMARLCAPPSDSCECSLVNVGLARSCNSRNSKATCFGFERCQADGGFSGCDARSATNEVCNGIDDDCDGLTDDDDPDQNVSGLANYPNCQNGDTCKGVWFCGPQPDGGVDAGFTFQCSAPVVVKEKCNGLDDDCDGLIDEDFKHDGGGFTGERACGSCALDCTTSIPNLERTDGGVGSDVAAGAVSCVNDSSGFRCSPKRCAAGYYPWPTLNPQICQKDLGSQCRPCTSHGDCLTPGDMCVTLLNDEGKYCLQSCADKSCPGSSSCQMLTGQKLCVPDRQNCSCTQEREGFSRSCLRTAGAQVCIGSQVCRADGGFDACDTTLTALELCDGLDNDCDGKVDQPFINTQGSGTYDSDEHCGNCTTHCTAQWSPTVQHAVGGCRTDAGAPHCVITRCTQDFLPAGKLCQLDGDCDVGQTCDPLFRQCRKTCTSGCSNNERCVDAPTLGLKLCARACNQDSECTTTFGVSARCDRDAGACVNTYSFFNSDRDSTNGCECPQAQGVIDLPDTYSSYPPAGRPYLDRDCDGLDGQASSALFVSNQSTSSQGTRQNPFKTLREAIQAFNPTVHAHILVAQGSYTEQVVLKNGVKMYGGYSSDFNKRDIVTFPTLIESPEPDFNSNNPILGSVNAVGISQTTEVSGFTIRGYDVVTRSAVGASAFNSYAVYARNSSGLRLVNNVIVGGRAGDASPGASGGAGADGTAGSAGRASRECNTPNCTNETQAGGAAGTNSECTVANATAGAGSRPDVDPQDYGPGGLNGRGGSNATYQQFDPSQSMYCKYDCIVPGGGLTGQPASNGGDGAAGNRGAGCTLNAGSIVGLEWRGASGASGAAGTPGRGGGGGGAGGCVINMNPSTCSIGRRVGDLGATGGGGGAGGCGGRPGISGPPGGGSFGVFILGAPIAMIGNIVEPGFGGQGGSGGAGGYGGLGASGGAGGDATTAAWCAGKAGAGGRGGNGGAGAGGGGGCGGVSFGIAGQNIDATALGQTNVLRAPPFNAAGEKGSGGASPAGSGAAGGDGLAGLTGTVRSF